MGITGGGGQAEYVVQQEGVLVKIPENLDFVQAAAIPEVFITAHDALFTQASLQMGERVLIHAIGSSVGIAAIQALNLVRIVSLFYLGQWDRDVFEWAHLYVWQALIMLDVLIVWLLWVRTLPRAAPSIAT